MQFAGYPSGFLHLHSLAAKIQASQWLAAQPLPTPHTTKHRAFCTSSQQVIQVRFLCKPASFPRSHDVYAWTQEHWSKFYLRKLGDLSLQYNQEIGLWSGANWLLAQWMASTLFHSNFAGGPWEWNAKCLCHGLYGCQPQVGGVLT